MNSFFGNEREREREREREKLFGGADSLHELEQKSCLGMGCI